MYLLKVIIINEVNRDDAEVPRPNKDAINPLQLFVEKHQFFNQNNQWLNNIMYHQIANLLLFWMA